jgi:hypothetical protein
VNEEALMNASILIGMLGTVGAYLLVKSIWQAFKGESVHSPGPGSEAPTPTVERGPRQWFLVRSKTGAVMVVQALGETPKTIAGPFQTKEEAYAAKES